LNGTGINPNGLARWKPRALNATAAIIVLALAGMVGAACSGESEPPGPTGSANQAEATAITGTTATSATATATAQVQATAAVITPAAETVAIVSVTSPVSRNGAASLTAKVAPFRACSLAYKGATSPTQELGSKPADANGDVNWTWTISPTTSPGAGTVTITCRRISASASIVIS
jgi:hypothetical protein